MASDPEVRDLVDRFEHGASILVRTSAVDVARKISASTAMDFQTAKEELLGYLALGIELEVAERAVRVGLPFRFVLDERARQTRATVNAWLQNPGPIRVRKCLTCGEEWNP